MLERAYDPQELSGRDVLEFLDTKIGQHAVQLDTHLDDQLVNLGHLRRAPATLPGNNLKLLGTGRRAHDQGLNHALLTQRIRQILECCRLKSAARLVGVRDKPLGRNQPVRSGGAIRTENQYPNSALVSDAQGVRRDLPYYFFLERYHESFAAELRAFVSAIQHGTPAAVTGYDGRVPVVMGLAAARSVRERRPVRLDEFDHA